MAINSYSFGLLQPNQPLNEQDKLLSDIDNTLSALSNVQKPPVNVPKYTNFGNKLSTLGGFGDQPNELLNQEQLAQMTQGQINAYDQERKKARTQGIAELLMRVGDAFQGRDATGLALQRKQARDSVAVSDAYMQAIKMAEQSGDFGRANLLRSLGINGYQKLQQERAFAELGGGTNNDPNSYREYVRTDSTPTQAEYLAFLDRNQKPASPGTMYEIVDGNNNFVGNISSKDYEANGYKKFEDMGIDTSEYKLKGLATGTQAADSNRMSTFSEENKPIADKWQAVSTLHGSLQRYGNELVKMDEAALSGVGGTSKFVTSIIENTKGFLQFASKDTNSFYNQAIADNSFVTADGTDYTEKVKSIANQYSINESEVRDLAFLFAAARGQEGRGLSDKDYENALIIVSGGVGKEGKIGVIKSVYNRLGGEVNKIVNDRIKRLEYQKTLYGPEKQDYFNIELGQLRSLQEATPFNPFSNPLLRQTTPAPTLTVEEILNDLDIKY